MNYDYMHKLLSLEGKNAIITGGSQGIGFAAATAFAAAGCEVIIAARKKTVNQAAVEKINSRFPGRASAQETDVSDPASVAALFQKAQQRFGHIDILVNDAGICSLTKPFEALDVQSWNRVMDVNLNGIMYCVKEAIPFFKKQQAGKIINVASLAGEVGGIATSADYVASKAAVIGLTKAVAADFIKKGIRSNAICPGTIQSPSLDQRIKDLAQATKTTEAAARQAFIDRQPMARLGTAEEIAWLAVYLAADESSYTTGQIHLADGGFAL